MVLEEITIKKIKNVEDLENVVEIEKSAWGMPDYKETTPVHILKAIVENGGIILGAFDKNKMIGFNMGWAVGCGEKQYFYSHMTGVLQEHKYKNIGYRLKLTQREEVLKLGIKLIKWTFDPLQSLNLNFNLEKLGAIGRIYKENYYGNIRDSINEGLETDRFEAEWFISSNYVNNKIQGKIKTPPFEDLKESGAFIAVEREIRGEVKNDKQVQIEVPIKNNFKQESKVVLIAIPKDVSSIRDFNKELAKTWRIYTRDAYKFYLSNGYIAAGYTKDKRNYGYVVLIKTDLNSLLEGIKIWS